jgi:RNA polymerase primary sigma factor
VTVATPSLTHRHPVPTREQQILLGRQIQEWQKLGDEAPERIKRRGIRAMHTLVLGNMGLAVAGARRCAARGVPLEDLIQAATIGLVQAATKFDPTLGYAFSTYATWWVKLHLQQEVRLHSAIKVPRAKELLWEQSRAAVPQLFAALGRMPTAQELAEALGVTLEALQAATWAVEGSRVVSLNQRMQQGDGGELSEVVGFCDMEEAYERLDVEVRSKQALEALKAEGEEVADLVMRVYGQGESTVAISRDSGVPRNKLRQQMAKAMRHVRVALAEPPIPSAQRDRGDGRGDQLHQEARAAA